MKKQIVISVLAALAAAPAAFATDYTGNVNIVGNTTIGAGDTITQPANFTFSGAGAPSLTVDEPVGTVTDLSNGATAYQTTLGTVTMNTSGNIGIVPANVTTSYNYVSFLGGTGGIGATGALNLDMSAASGASFDVLVTGDQSIEAGALNINTADPTLMFGQFLSFVGGETFSNDTAQTVETLQSLTLSGGNVQQILVDNTSLAVGVLNMTGSGFNILSAVNRGGGVVDSVVSVGTLNVGNSQVISAEPGTALTVNLHNVTSPVNQQNALNFNAAPGSATEPGGTLVVNDNGGTINAAGGVMVESYGTTSAFPDLGHVTLNMAGTIDASYVDFEPGASLSVPDSGDGLNIGSAGDGSNPNFGATATLTLQGSAGDTYNYWGTVSGAVRMTGGNLHVEPYGAGMTVTGNYMQTGGDLYIPMTPSRVFTLNAGGYDITGGNVYLDAAQGTYQKGGYTFIKAAGGGDTYAPANTYFVYNGANSSVIGGLPAALQVNPSNVQVCLGGTCSTPAQTTTTTTTTTSSAAPVVVTPAPTATPVSVPASSAAPVISPPAPVVTPTPIQVQVVTPVQEASSTIAESPQATLVNAKDTSTALISTGIVGGGPRGLWMKGLGGFSNQGNYHGDNEGVLLGYGKSVGPDKRDVLGAAFSAGQAGLGTGSSDFTKASDYGLWLYGTYYPQTSRAWKITGTIGGGMSTNTLMSTALGLPQTAHFSGGFVGTEIRASYWKTLPVLDNIIVSPRLSVGYDQSWTGGFQTHGGGPLDVNVSGQSDGQLYLSPAILVGKKFDYRSQSGNHVIFPQIRLGAVENIGPSPSAEISSGQVAGQVQGPAYPHLQGMAEVRLDVISHTRFSKGLSANVSARQLFGGGASSTEFVAAIKYHW
ncbi:autotransporter outer membrane beta-barrel domain-containing protein [Acidithiobacillus sp.]|uniref:autotransporter outer membrane beta-barrel domain-containing protein n=1 Tax=Acidithiobacillus sp. TaxID=1872118 RepID=UPI00231BD3C7|nr:autotransporter outer membrane beta-barrel domain-containing protein [Acidithiobacillus sp.]MDA8246959.1 autotransporter outer membrane beta-barrel domain-containing protein [Acidithiobacillus sp.]